MSGVSAGHRIARAQQIPGKQGLGGSDLGTRKCLRQPSIPEHTFSVSRGSVVELVCRWEGGP
eukprot:1019752-Rhodomonas_salina.1